MAQPAPLPFHARVHPGVFADRAAAGRELAHALAPWRGSDAMVLALPRGGVIVADAVARALDAPLEVLIVRKIGLPANPEYAIGAMAEDGTVMLDPAVARAAGLDEAGLERVVTAEKRELYRRVAVYRAGRALPPMAGRTVLIVDDGVATGWTARAAIRAVRRAGATQVVFGAPVVAATSTAALRAEVEALVALQVPADLRAIGDWYDAFDAVSDAEVLHVLDGHRRAEAATRE